MAFSLDHVVIAVGDLDLAARDYGALGFTVTPGGIHANGATHNALVVFGDGSYLELLALTGQPPQGDAADFSPLVRQGKGIVAYALLSHDMDTDAARLREGGLPIGEVREGRRLRHDGVELRWKTALVREAMTPFLIQDITPRPLRVPGDASAITHANSVIGIRDLVDTGDPSTRRVTLRFAAPHQIDTSLRDIAQTHGARFDQVVPDTRNSPGILPLFDEQRLFV